MCIVIVLAMKPGFPGIVLVMIVRGLCIVLVMNVLAMKILVMKIGFLGIALVIVLAMIARGGL